MQTNPTKRKTIIWIQLVLIGLSLLSCSSPESNTLVYGLNMTGKKLMFSVDNNERLTFPYKGVPVGMIGLKKGNYTMVSQNLEGLKQEEFSLSIDPEKDGRGVQYFINPEGKGSFAFININGLYKGGGVFNLTANDDFKVEKKIYNEKVFSYSQAGTIIIAGTGVPSTIGNINEVHYLLPITNEMQEDSSILNSCSKFLARETIYK